MSRRIVSKVSLMFFSMGTNCWVTTFIVRNTHCNYEAENKLFIYYLLWLKSLFQDLLICFYKYFNEKTYIIFEISTKNCKMRCIFGPVLLYSNCKNLKHIRCSTPLFTFYGRWISLINFLKTPTIICSYCTRQVPIWHWYFWVSFS